MRKPTKPHIGQHVLYYDDQEAQPHAAIITDVTSDIVVNVAVFGADGSVQPKQGINYAAKNAELPKARYVVEQ